VAHHRHEVIELSLEGDQVAAGGFGLLLQSPAGLLEAREALFQFDGLRRYRQVVRRPSNRAYGGPAARSQRAWIVRQGLPRIH